MLFNSSVFLYAFLPLTLIGFYVLAHGASVGAAKLWLCLASFVFYGWWNPAFLLLLAGSIAFNYTLSLRLKESAEGEDRSQSLLLAGGVAANLLLLFYFKYLFHLLKYLHGLGWLRIDPGSVILPLGISFFTFTQVGYLVDCRQGLVRERGLLNYILFVTFFPHLIAGPILHHREVMPQFANPATYRLKAENLAMGLTLFAVGLFKKVVLADGIAPWVEAGYAHVPGTQFVQAWSVVLAYSMQLYFDFSGYSDMAIALGIMFGIKLPLNFNSPYKSTSIIDYWQRFHMTLTRYLTLLLYNPLSIWITRRRTKKGLPIGRQAANTPSGFAAMIAFPTITTMLLAGIWHGAGLQYLIFGLLHGVYISINHVWRVFFPVSSKPAPPSSSRLLRFWRGIWPVALTFLAAIVALIFFRADSTADALTMLRAMLGANGSGLPLPVFVRGASLGMLQPWLIHWHVLVLATASAYQEITLPLLLNTLLMLLLSAIAFGAPNIYQIMDHWSPALTKLRARPRRAGLSWSPKWYWALVCGVMLFWATLRFDHPARFLYFQF